MALPPIPRRAFKKFCKSLILNMLLGWHGTCNISRMNPQTSAPMNDKPLHAAAVPAPEPVSGSAMDQALPPRRGKRLPVAVLALALLLVAGWALRHGVPQGLTVAASDVRLAHVERGLFLDNLVVRASAVPLNSVLLDSMESGRVEQVLVKDGASVEAGQLLFRLNNPQRHLELLARESEYAQQITNLSNLRASLEATRGEIARRRAESRFSLAQAQKQQLRDVRLQQQGFVSAQALDEGADKLTLQQQLQQDFNASSTKELAIRQDAVTQLESAVARLQSGLALVHAGVDALAVRAPVAGRLLDFHLQVGEIVRPEQHLGRIDDPQHFKLSAQIDEFYLNRIAPGLSANATLQDSTVALKVTRISPQIKDGRFTIELEFQNPLASAAAHLSAGSSLDVELTLGEAKPALLLPNGAFMADSGGNFVYVLNAAHTLAMRREIRSGRRNPRQLEVLGGLQAGETVIVSGYAAFGKTEQLRLE